MATLTSPSRWIGRRARAAARIGIGRGVIAAALLVAAACDGGGGGDAVDAGPLLDAGPGDYHADRAGFVNLIEGGAFLSVFALVQDGPELPVPVALAQAGDCTVFRRPRPALCEPACDGVCTAPGTCVPWPRNVDAGTITVTGLRQPLRFERGDFGYEPTPFPPAELFADDAAITVAAPGAELAGFSVALTGVPALAGAPTTLSLMDGTDLPIAWTAAGAGRIQLALVVGWHGAPYEAMLLCETDDDGELTVPGTLVTALPRASSGLESHVSTIMRFRRASVLGPAGPIDIVVGNQAVVHFTRGGAAR